MGKWIYDFVLAKRLLADDRLMVMNWEEEWASIGVFPKVGSKLTAQNVRGMLKRKLPQHNYIADILEDEQPMTCDNLRTGIVMRFRQMSMADYPSQRRKAYRAFEPPAPTEQLRMRLT